MAEHLAETKNTEPVPEEVIFRYLDGVGNHESKNLLAAIALSHPNEDFTGASARREMNSRQGDIPVWPVNPAGAQQYFERSLEPVGAVVKDRIAGERGKPVNAWRASDEFLDTKLALAGFISDWSLRWPQHSVQRVFGNTHSPNEAVRSPKIRSQIYWGLLTSPVMPSMRELAKSTDYNDIDRNAAFSAQMLAMTNDGLIETISKHNERYDPIFEIRNSAYRHVAIPFERATPQTKALYTAMETLGEDTRVSLNELVERVQAVDPRLDGKKIRGSIIAGTVRRSDRNHGGLPGLVKIETPGIADSAFSSVRFAEGVAEPVAELIEGIEAIRCGKNIDIFCTRAKEILANPAEFARLMKKARDFSPYHAAKERTASEGSSEQLLAVVRSLGETTVAGARSALIEHYGTTLGARSVSEKLKLLARAGILGVEAKETSKNNQRVLNHYFIESGSKSDE